MPIPEPTFDSRGYREILNEALARIPVHNPEWTNFSDADPGVTLLQLFAFMSESIIYRANRIPERNRRKFLRLLGESVRAPEPARGLVSFSNPRGALQSVGLAEDLEVLAGKIPFRTGNALEVLPIEARVYYKAPLSTAQSEETETLYRRLYASFEQEQGALSFYETRRLEPPQAGAPLPVVDLAKPLATGGTASESHDTVDGALWLALFARPNEDPVQARAAIAGRALTLGAMPALGSSGCLLPPGGTFGSEDLGLLFEVPNTAPDASGEVLDRYSRVEARGDTNLLLHPGVVELSLPGAAQLGYWDDLDPLEAGAGNFPPALEDTADAARLVTWIRVRPAPNADGTDAQGLQARFSWLGINAAEVVQRAWVPSESLPRGTGEPDQGATLTHRPVLLETVTLRVNGEPWQRVDDLSAAPPEVQTQAATRVTMSDPTASGGGGERVYTLDRESGEIRFGDGLHGTRPPLGAQIQVSYAHGGGVAGMVGTGAITKGPGLPAGIKVANPLPTYGGDRGETLSEAERRIPAFLHHRDRLVAPQDFVEIAWRTPGVELGRVEVLPLVHPEQAAQVSRGVVTLLVVPAADALHPRSPEPDRLFLEAVCRYLAPRRLVTTELHVRGPVYEDTWLSLGIEVVPGREQSPVRDAVKAAVETFVSPLTGGFEAAGWPLEKTVDPLEINAVASRVSGVAKVVGVLLGDAAGAARERIELSGLQLPRLRGVAVSSGAPTPLDLLLGASGGTLAGQRQPFPVPVVPVSC
jgi:hypothetical protein